MDNVHCGIFVPDVKVAAAAFAAAFPDVFSAAEQKRKGMFGHGPRIGAGAEHHRYPALGGGRHVYRVVPDAWAGNYFQVFAGGNCFPVYFPDPEDKSICRSEFRADFVGVALVGDDNFPLSL